MVVSCLGVVVQGGIIQKKMFEGQKSRGNCPIRNFMRVTVQRELFRGNFLGIKVRDG